MRFGTARSRSEGCAMNPPESDAWVAHDPIPCPECGSEVCEDPAHLPSTTTTNRHTRPRRIYNDVALMNVDAPSCLVEGRIIANSLVLWYGPSGAYKTFGNINLNVSVATG